MNIFRLKSKIFHFINFCFYFVIFIFGYLCGSSKINISKFFQIENVYAVYGDAPYYYTNYVNYYLPENLSTWNVPSYGFSPNRPMQAYEDYQDSITSHHVYNYLEQVTRYLTDNYSGLYDFVIVFRRYNHNHDINGMVYNLLQTYNNYRNNAYASSIYIFYFPKGSLEYFDFKGYSWLYGYPKSNNMWDLSGYISGSGFDIIPLSYVSGDNENWYLDSVWNNSSFNIIDYLHYIPNFIDYDLTIEDYLANNTFFNNVVSYDNGIYQQDINDVIMNFQMALSGLRFVFPMFDYSYDSTGVNGFVSQNPDSSGALYYYGSIPIINNSTQSNASQPTYFFIGSHAFAPGEEIPTYADVRGLEFTNLHDYVDISDYMNMEDYRIVCSSTQALMINTYGTSNAVSVFVPEDWQSNDNFVTYDFYSYDVDNNTNLKLDSNTSFFTANYLSLGNINTYGFPDFLEGFTYIHFVPGGTNNFVISRSDFSTELYSNNLFLPSSSDSHHSYDNNFFNYYDPITGITHDNYNLEQVHFPSSDGGWCVYINSNAYVQSLNVDNADAYRSSPLNPTGLNKQDISFSGLYMDSNGDLHQFEYVNSSFSISNTDTAWSYSEDFYNSNYDTFNFLSSLLHYFFNNVNSSVYYFCIIVSLFFVFYKVLNFYNGGDK